MRESFSSRARILPPPPDLLKEAGSFTGPLSEHVASVSHWRRLRGTFDLERMLNQPSGPLDFCLHLRITNILAFNDVEQYASVIKPCYEGADDYI